jgi:hypothetical protein
MYRKLDNGNIAEYVIIPAQEQLVGVFSPEEFAEYENLLKEKIAQDPKKLGDEIIAETQIKLSEVIATKEI